MTSSAAPEARADTPALRLGAVDPVLAAVAISLLGFGVVMVFGASSIDATVSYKNPFYFLQRQALYAGAGLVVMLGLSRFDYRKLRRLTYPALAAVTALLTASVIGFGHTGGGAARWLRLGPSTSSPPRRPSWR
ncbi:MAG TPA: FtsW/RodA/SpoVE family cell cycle protein [Polyangiaceae bacterium]|nr:FtsW/RodA/SpoVE family cell cycle protein [Polyangiaceae bacterium]